MNKSLVAVSEHTGQPSCAAPVLLPTLVEGAFDYLVPTGTLAGTLVETTLAGRKLVGAVWDVARCASPAGEATRLSEQRELSRSLSAEAHRAKGDGEGTATPVSPSLTMPSPNPLPRGEGFTTPPSRAYTLKPITRIIDSVPPLANAYREWLDWIAEFTLAPKGAVMSLCGLAHAARLTKKPLIPQQFSIQLPTLTPDQQAAADALTSSNSKPTLLDGVTGSGKTEVYFHAIAAAIEAGKQVLVLLPEIALTHQWYERFEKTFGAKPCAWHSRMTPVAKARAWQAIARGDVQVVVGARSALFLPFNNLALIVVDEEHDPSYKQEDGVLYHARDMAIARAHFEKIPIILASATPSLETMENVREGKYRALHLTSRYGAAGLPDVKLVDMRNNPAERGDFISPVVKEAMMHTLARGEQVLFFLNRRGYAPLLLCRACGHRFECSHCSAWLVVHNRNRLECHHCGHKEPLPKACPSCAAPAEKLAPCGPGVERIAEEVRGMFAADIWQENPETRSIPSPSGGGLGWGLAAKEAWERDTRKGHPQLKTLAYARELRKNLTEAEKKLWRLLRSKTLGVKFRKQQPIGSYIADFVSYEPKIIIELDGGQHNDLEAIAYDKTRSDFLNEQGFTVMRFWNNEMLENSTGVLARISEAIEQLKCPISPHPNPPPEGEGILPTAHDAPRATRQPSLITLSSDESIPAETWAAIEAGEIDILVGTQMVAKGHHFPRLTLVVVVDADVGLDGADLRAGERSYQLLHQLGGRAGRGELAGQVLVQTYNPDHPVMKALVAHDRDRLMALEAKERRAGNWPPFGQLAAILLDGKDDATVRAAGQMLARTAPDDARLKVLGPAPAPLSKLRGQYRYRLLVKATDGIHLQRTLRGWLGHQKFKGVRVKVDVNPYYFM